jgi:hypothetical protein
MSANDSNMNKYKDITDPEYVGPGTWNVIHRLSFNARTNDAQLSFITIMNEICKGFPCPVCRGHCSEYIKNHPIEEYLNVTMDIDDKKLNLGIFIWGWKFHNAVNKRLNKQIMTWDTAYNFYSDSDSSVCSSVCMNSKEIVEPESEKTHHEKMIPVSNIIKKEEKARSQFKLMGSGQNDKITIQEKNKNARYSRKSNHNRSNNGNFYNSVVRNLREPIIKT